MRPLTDDEQHLVSMNIGLAFKAAHQASLRYHVPKDDLVSAAVYGLARSVLTYDPEKSQFSTYGSLCAYRYAVMEARVLRRFQRKHIFFTDGLVGHELLIDQKQLRKPPASDYWDLDWAMGKLKKKNLHHYHVVDEYFCEDLTLSEIAEKRGYSKQRAAQVKEMGLNFLRSQFSLTQKEEQDVQTL